MELYPWQLDALSHNHRPKLLIKAAPRMGKSLVGIEWLSSVGARVSIIVAPLVVCPQWAFLASRSSEVVPLYAKTAREITTALQACKATLKPIVLVINYDKLKGCLDQLIKLKPGALILDESHYAKSASSSRGRAARRLAANVERVRLLTGTVAPNGPGDLWGQFTCIDQEMWGKSYTAFAKRHLVVDVMMYNRVVGLRDPKKLQAMIDTCSLTYNREDHFGRDEWVESIREVELEPRARKLYHTIVKEWILERERDGFELSMVHTLSRMKRLQQLTSGYLPGDEGEGTLVHTNKSDLVMEDLGEIIAAGEKAVVFHQFTWEGDHYYERCKRAGYTVFSISGADKGDQRARSIAEFTAHGGGAVFIIQTAAGGIGISLASATHALFVSQSFSFDAERQARDRIYAPGKARFVTYYQVVKSIDRYIAHILQSKANFNQAVAESSIQDIAFGEALDLPTFKGY